MDYYMQQYIKSNINIIESYFKNMTYKLSRMLKSCTREAKNIKYER